MEQLLEGESDRYGEPFLGGLMKGVGSMLGLGEGEDEGWGETPLGETMFEGEGFGDREQFLDGVVKGVGGMLGLGEGEGEGEGSFEYEGFGDHEGEQFFRKALKKALPILKAVAKKAAPLVGTAVAGPLGGKIASLATGLLGEGEYELEGEGFGDHENEAYFEAETEAVLESPLTESQAIGEMMAAVASQAATDTEAEAQIGAAIAISLTPEERRALRELLPAVTRGAAVLTRILRRHPATRSAVPAVVPIVRRTAVVLKNRAASGAPITKKTAAKAMARQTRKVLASPAICSRAIQRNARATTAVMRNSRNRRVNGY
ncbi:MAG TPA: hypothetical protein VF824_18035 [Thermoanaerobaculia bacterium]